MTHATTPKFNELVKRAIEQGLEVTIVDTDTPDCLSYKLKREASVGFKFFAATYVLRSNGEEHLTRSTKFTLK